MTWWDVAGLLWLTLILALLIWGCGDLVDDWRRTEEQFTREEE